MSQSWPNFADALPFDGVLAALSDEALGKRLKAIGDLYDRRKPDRVPARDSPAIPRIIHQIWLGSAIPRPLRRYSDAWRRQHPDWEVRIWTDQDVASLEFGTRDLFDTAGCWGQKSDILRAELLDRFGGVYVDLDYQCYGKLDPLVERYDFFGTLRNVFTAHLGWPAVWRSPIVVCNSLFGARPGHPVLRSYLAFVRDVWHQRDRTELREGELPRLALAAMGGFAKATRIKETGTRTYLPFDEVVTAHVLAVPAGPDADILLPPPFFNPVMAGARMLYAMPDFWTRCRAAGIRWPDIRPYNRRMPYSIGKHLSKNSWV